MSDDARPADSLIPYDRWTDDALREVVMRRSGVTADWRVCVGSSCRAMAELVPAEADPVVLKPCP